MTHHHHHRFLCAVLGCHSLANTGIETDSVMWIAKGLLMNRTLTYLDLAVGLGPSPQAHVNTPHR